MTYLTSRLARLWQDEGGWLSAALAGAGVLGSLFGKGAQKSAEGRQQETLLNSQRDGLRNQQYGTQQGAEMQAANVDLQRKNFEENSRGGRAKQAVIGDLLARLQDVNINVPGIQNAQISGGLRPSAMGEGGRAAGAELSRQALMKQLAGDTFTGGQVLQAPGLSALPQASGWEKAAGIMGTIGSLAGAVGSMLPGKKAAGVDIDELMKPKYGPGSTDTGW